MNEKQKKFLQVILQRVEAGNQEKVKALLEESFAKQDDGTFCIEYLQSINPKILKLIKPQFYEEVKDIIYNFKA